MRVTGLQPHGAHADRQQHRPARSVKGATRMKRRSSRTFLALCALFALGLVAAILGLPRAANGRILATSTTPTGPPITTTNRSGATGGNQAAAGKGVWMAFEIQP